MSLPRTLLACLLFLAAAAAQARELIPDPAFQQGFNVFDPAPGKHVDRGPLTWPGVTGAPVWGIAQWSSKHSLAGVPPETLPSGAFRFADASKYLIAGGPESPGADLVMGMDSRQEFHGQYRKQDEPWPHLLVEQSLPGSPALAEVPALRFRVQCRLTHAERFESDGYNPGLHAAQFLIYFTVQNLNPASTRHGDYLWLGVPLYDDRAPSVGESHHMDKGTGKMIYTPPFSAYSAKSLHTGEWIAIDVDLLPIAMRGLEIAWAEGLLADSKDLSHYHLSGMNMGYEMPGINKVEVQIRGLSLSSE
ncbi:MAG: hypothetical protein HYV27_05825 [Candidatus Hydrogenedentes bacterium]|nr:hypothetical protein [Candidatus Hydrogenedentota bacterium]